MCMCASEFSNSLPLSEFKEAHVRMQIVKIKYFE